MTRYGMKFTTIRYAQNQGRLLHNLVAWKPKHFSVKGESKRVAIDAIAAMVVCTPEEFKALLDGRNK